MPLDEELKRVVPVIQGIRAPGIFDATGCEGQGALSVLEPSQVEGTRFQPSRRGTCGFSSRSTNL